MRVLSLGFYASLCFFLIVFSYGGGVVCVKKQINCSCFDGQEILDFGYPQSTDPDALKLMITTSDGGALVKVTARQFLTLYGAMLLFRCMV